MMSGVKIKAAYKSKSDDDSAHSFHKITGDWTLQQTKSNPATSLILISLCRYAEPLRQVPQDPWNYRSRSLPAAPFLRKAAAPASGARPLTETLPRSGCGGAGENVP